MPGRHVTDHQMRLFMTFRQTEAVPAAAAKAGISTATGYRLARDPRLPSQKKTPRGRRRRDPSAEVFDSEVVPLLKAAPGLRPIAVLEELLRRHPPRSAPACAARWSVVSGPGVRTTDAEREVIFRQDHPPGQQGLSDFTDMASLASSSPARRSLIASITSSWRIPLGSMPRWCSAARATRRWLAACRTRCGHSAAPQPSIAPTAFQRRSATSTGCAEDQTRRYEALCAHYGMQPTRNNRGVAHENGAIESPHGHLKRAVAQAFLLRGSTAFDDLGAYRRFVDEIVGRRNARNGRRSNQ